MITAAQHRMLEAAINEHGIDRERLKAWVLRKWGVAHWFSKDAGGGIDRDQLNEILRNLPKFAAATRRSAPTPEPSKTVTMFAADGSGSLQERPEPPHRMWYHDQEEP